MVATAELASLTADRQWNNPRNGRWGYYKRLSDGWVVKGPAWPFATAHNAAKGLLPLTQYGYYKDDDLTGAAGAWCRPLLEKGGAREFTAAQILDQGWHRTPPHHRGAPVLHDGRPIEFPQLPRTPDGGVVLPDGTELHEPKCPHCAQPTYFLNEDILRRHESIAHKDIAETDAMVRGMSSATQATAAATAGKLDEAIRTLADGQQQLAQQLAEQQATTNALLSQFIAMTTPADREPPKAKRKADEQPPAA